MCVFWCVLINEFREYGFSYKKSCNNVELISTLEKSNMPTSPGGMKKRDEGIWNLESKVVNMKD